MSMEITIIQGTEEITFCSRVTKPRTESCAEKNSDHCQTGAVSNKAVFVNLYLSRPISRSSQADEFPSPNSIQHHVPDVFYAVQVCVSHDDIVRDLSIIIRIRGQKNSIRDSKFFSCRKTGTGRFFENLKRDKNFFDR